MTQLPVSTACQVCLCVCVSVCACVCGLRGLREERRVMAVNPVSKALKKCG